MQHINIKEIMGEYMPCEEDLFSDDPYNLLKIKHIIFNILNESERRILILYAEFGSMRKVADITHLSLGTIHKYINGIRKKIKNML